MGSRDRRGVGTILILAYCLYMLGLIHKRDLVASACTNFVCVGFERPLLYSHFFLPHLSSSSSLYVF